MFMFILIKLICINLLFLFFIKGEIVFVVDDVGEGFFVIF